MAALAYHVISKEVENHIFKHNLIFRHLCIYTKKSTKKNLCNGHHFFDCMTSFLCHFILLSMSTPYPFSSDINIYNIAMGGVLCDDVMGERSKT